VFTELARRPSLTAVTKRDTSLGDNAPIRSTSSPHAASRNNRAFHEYVLTEIGRNPRSTVKNSR
jgi:hypothetical protein